MSTERDLKSLSNRLSFHAPRLQPITEAVEQALDLSADDPDLGEAGRACMAAMQKLEAELQELLDVVKARQQGASL